MSSSRPAPIGTTRTERSVTPASAKLRSRFDGGVAPGGQDVTYALGVAVPEELLVVGGDLGLGEDPVGPLDGGGHLPVAAGAPRDAGHDPGIWAIGASCAACLSVGRRARRSPARQPSTGWSLPCARH